MWMKREFLLIIYLNHVLLSTDYYVSVNLRVWPWIPFILSRYLSEFVSHVQFIIICCFFVKCCFNFLIYIFFLFLLYAYTRKVHICITMNIIKMLVWFSIFFSYLFIRSKTPRAKGFVSTTRTGRSQLETLESSRPHSQTFSVQNWSLIWHFQTQVPQMW